MNVVVRRTMTIADYLAWAESQDDMTRTELINGQVVAMSPELVVHTRIKGAVFVTLRLALKNAGIEGEVFTDGLTVPIDPHTAYEPDASLRLGTPLPAQGMTMTDPLIVVEVLSPSSVHFDTSAKLIGYFKIASVRHYLIIDPDARTVTHHARGEDGAVTARTLSGGTLYLVPPGLTVSVSDLLG